MCCVGSSSDGMRWRVETEWQRSRDRVATLMRPSGNGHETEWQRSTLNALPQQEELDEVEGQLSEQRHSALNHKAMAMSLKGEKEILDKLIAQSQVLSRFSLPCLLARSLSRSLLLLLSL
jgi:hypothetical protein